MSDEFKIRSAGAMRAEYGLMAENRPAIALDPARVPGSLHHLIPLAERFGIADDLIRQDVLAKTAAEELEAMKQAVRPLEDALDAWLAGPEAENPHPSDEYVAFTCLRMSADETSSRS
jgi:hypothetical protein